MLLFESVLPFAFASTVTRAIAHANVGNHRLLESLKVILKVNKVDVGITGLINTVQRYATLHKAALQASVRRRDDVGTA